ncbi:potassium channel family protein [Rugosibacter aromaticivorans]|uniref:potassium channel family protein n=1 Tax=Rugosibacter aromaticivorans TaxID=1565605 RepID=UPI0012101FE1|nr:potassium channel family protein [Rugosibacter aromaticivorans]TBR12810.1 MAG: potassium channel protein [Rugosibacter sp.]
MLNPRTFFGIGGVAPHDTPATHLWMKRLHWPMMVVALLALPALWIDIAPPDTAWHGVGRALDALIFAAFSAELLWMLHVSREPWHYVARNWLSLVIIAAATASLFGIEGHWLVLTRLMRVIWASLLLARTLATTRALLRATLTPWILTVGVITMALSGEIFYWLEPTVHSYGEGLWLAFVTGSTVGYGDVIPTTLASRLFAVLIVIIGFALLSLVTASIAAFLIGEDEKKLRHEMHHDIRLLREEVSALRAEIHRSHTIPPPQS